MVKLFSKNSNLCDHNSPTSQTDRQTDGRTDGQTDDMRSQYRALHLSASRGKNGFQTTQQYSKIGLTYVMNADNRDEASLV